MNFFKQIKLDYILPMFLVFEKMTSRNWMTSVQETGMTILVIIAVSRIGFQIFWVILFGKRFEWKFSLLDFLLGFLPVNRVVKEIEEHGKDPWNDKSIARGEKKMQKFLTELKTNKLVYSTYGSLGALVVTIALYVAAQFGWINQEMLGLDLTAEYIQGLILAEIMTVIPLAGVTIKGPGLETEEGKGERIANKDVIKQEKKAAKIANDADKNRKLIASTIIKKAIQVGADPVEKAIKEGTMSIVIAEVVKIAAEQMAVEPIEYAKGKKLDIETFAYLVKSLCGSKTPVEFAREKALSSEIIAKVTELFS